MADATTARSDSASCNEELCPPERKLGTHRMDDSDPAFEALPDLTSGRTLPDAIAALNWTMANDPSAYGKAWTDELRDIGVTAICVRTEDGDKIQICHPCDHQLLDRRERSDALIAHFHATDFGRDMILDHLRRIGSAYGYMFRIAPPPADAEGR